MYVVRKNSFFFYVYMHTQKMLSQYSFLRFILLCSTLLYSRTIQCHLNTNARLILNIYTYVVQVSKRKLAILQRTNITFLSYENTVNICIEILAKIYFYLRNIALSSAAVATLIMLQVGFFMSIEFFFPSTSDKGQYTAVFCVFANIA